MEVKWLKSIFRTFLCVLRKTTPSFDFSQSSGVLVLESSLSVCLHVCVCECVCGCMHVCAGVF